MQALPHTETMADLYLRQGHVEPAAAIYRQLLDQADQAREVDPARAARLGEKLREAVLRDLLGRVTAARREGAR